MNSTHRRSLPKTSRPAVSSETRHGTNEGDWALTSHSAGQFSGAASPLADSPAQPAIDSLRRQDQQSAGDRKDLREVSG